jgi:hypothetical protein
VQKSSLLLLGAYRSTDIDIKRPLTPVLAESKIEWLPRALSAISGPDSFQGRFGLLLAVFFAVKARGRLAFGVPNGLRERIKRYEGIISDGRCFLHYHFSVMSVQDCHTESQA